MGVRDQDMRYRLALDGIEQRLGMRLVVGTGIDDRDIALAHDVTDRAGEGERARIVAEDAPHAGTGFLDHAGLQGEIAIEGNVVVVGHYCSCSLATTKPVIPRESGVSSNRRHSRSTERPLGYWIARLRGR